MTNQEAAVTSFNLDKPVFFTLALNAEDILNLKGRQVLASEEPSKPYLELEVMGGSMGLNQVVVKLLVLARCGLHCTYISTNTRKLLPEATTLLAND